MWAEHQRLRREAHLTCKTLSSYTTTVGTTTVTLRGLASAAKVCSCLANPVDVLHAVDEVTLAWIWTVRGTMTALRSDRGDVEGRGHKQEALRSFVAQAEAATWAPPGAGTRSGDANLFALPAVEAIVAEAAELGRDVPDESWIVAALRAKIGVDAGLVLDDTLVLFACPSSLGGTERWGLLNGVAAVWALRDGAGGLVLAAPAWTIPWILRTHGRSSLTGATMQLAVEPDPDVARTAATLWDPNGDPSGMGSLAEALASARLIHQGDERRSA